ncbi:DUF3606 domain-containing protein [Vineibacter terrae]|uniref:DUF3606 domain-containing protein n=1 Tax=Vineibacter terrae TaxID=2586908 RepID=UPI002E2EC95F|nr:DUF3606 domain-containing protein [Vineibacter terrae]HEX2890932.1 DUF3606 domain-containing protein [Vineibacter terrae]
MADDKTKVGKSDRIRINVSEDYELRNWSEALGVTPDELLRAVRAVGPMVRDVRLHLGK